MIVLNKADARLGVLPETGGALAFWTCEGRALLHPVSDPNLADQHGEAVAAYPLVPYSNRIADGRFTFEGHDYQLARNFVPERNSIHGNAWQHGWQVAEHGDDYVRLVFDHDTGTAEDRAEWPFAYHAAILYRLSETSLDVTLTVHNTDTRRQPVGMGFHPFLPKPAGTRLGFRARSVWHKNADNLPDGRLHCEGRLLYSPARTLDGIAIDHCFSGWDQVAEITWPDETGLELTADPVFGHFVAYVPEGRDFLATEPATNMTDAINHLDLPDAGLAILEPGAHLAGWARLRRR